MDYTRRQAEVLVDTMTHIVLAQAGLDVAGETVPYIAGWGENGALEALSAYAKTIDDVARKLERAISSGHEPVAVEPVAEDPLD